MLVDKCVLLELKAGRALVAAHEAQLLNYLRATEIEVGILFSFGLKPEFKRLAYDNTRKKRGTHPDLLTTLLTANDDFSNPRSSAAKSCSTNEIHAVLKIQRPRHLRHQSRRPDGRSVRFAARFRV